MYSVIIPSLGRIKFLNDLLDSIYNQTILPQEVIILLDENKKCRKGEQLINTKNFCKIIFCNKLNLSQKRNFGSQIAKTKYLIFSDDDDLWKENKGELTIESLKNSQVVCHEYTKFGSFYQKPKFIMGKKRKFVELVYLLFASNIFGGGSAIASLREIVLAIPFNEDYEFCEDYDWWIKILLAEIKIEYLPVPLVKYRVHEKNMTSNFLKIFKYNRKIFNKLVYKSIILFLTFVVGYIKSCLKTLIKLFFLISIKR